MDVAPIGNPGQPVLVAPDHGSSPWQAENRDLIRNIKSMDASALFGEGRELAFALDRDTRRPVVRVLDQQSGEVLWQAPPEYILRLAQIMSQHSG